MRRMVRRRSKIPVPRTAGKFYLSCWWTSLFLTITPSAMHIYHPALASGTPFPGSVLV